MINNWWLKVTYRDSREREREESRWIQRGELMDTNDMRWERCLWCNLSVSPLSHESNLIYIVVSGCPSRGLAHLLSSFVWWDAWRRKWCSAGLSFFEWIMICFAGALRSLAGALMVFNEVLEGCRRDALQVCRSWSY